MSLGDKVNATEAAGRYLEGGVGSGDRHDWLGDRGRSHVEEIGARWREVEV
jgi:hypothetical protein